MSIDDANQPHREPYVGEGLDGRWRSVQIHREEADGLDLDDPRYAECLASAERWGATGRTARRRP